MINNEFCSFCSQLTEDEIHLFCDCTIVKRLWQQLQEYVHQSLRAPLTQSLCWNNSSIVFNLVHPKPGHAINFIVLITKQYIYRCRCQQQKPIFQQLQYEIENNYDVEYAIAVKNNKLKQHAIKWSAFKDIDIPDTNDFVNQYLSNL